MVRFVDDRFVVMRSSAKLVTVYTSINRVIAIGLNTKSKGLTKNEVVPRNVSVVAVPVLSVELPAGAISRPRPQRFKGGTMKINRETPRAENIELFEQHLSLWF